MRVWFWLSLIAGVIGTQYLLWFTQVPLGIPGEWDWHRLEPEPDTGWNLLGAAMTAVLYMAFVAAGGRRLARSMPGRQATVEVAVWLAGLVAVSFVWLWIVQESAPTTNRLGKSAFVLYYANSSGYFSKIRYEHPDPQSFLKGYEQLMREGDVLHVGTHPPGLFLVFHSLIEVSQLPGLDGLLDATQPASFRDACNVIASNSVRSSLPRPFLPADRRVLWLATLLVMAAAAMSVVPLYLLLRRTQEPSVAWWTASLWPAVPSVAIFVPKSDVAYALIGLLLVLAWLTAVDRKSVLLAFTAGVLTWCSLMLSLAFLPVILFTAILGSLSVSKSVVPGEAVHSITGGVANYIPPVRCLVSGLAGLLIPTAFMGWYGVNLFAVWWLNYRNHAGFYAKYTRTYWEWLLINPIELTFAAGWPLQLVAVVGAVVALRTGLRTPVAHVVIAVSLVWGSLWLTGKNSGEAARLWIVFLPWLVWLAGAKLAEIERFDKNYGWIAPSMILEAQLATSVLTVACVDGFKI
jgi:hypothetical protein